MLREKQANLKHCIWPYYSSLFRRKQQPTVFPTPSEHEKSGSTCWLRFWQGTHLVPRVMFLKPIRQRISMKRRRVSGIYDISPLDWFSWALCWQKKKKGSRVFWNNRLEVLSHGYCTDCCVWSHIGTNWNVYLSFCTSLNGEFPS